MTNTPDPTPHDGTFTLTIETGNAAFEDNLGSELARLLRLLADRLAGRPGLQSATGALYDVNGNRVGSFRWTAADPRHHLDSYAPYLDRPRLHDHLVNDHAQDANSYAVIDYPGRTHRTLHTGSPE